MAHSPQDAMYGTGMEPFPPSCLMPSLSRETRLLAAAKEGIGDRRLGPPRTENKEDLPSYCLMCTT